MPVNVMGKRRSPAYQKMTNASGNQNEPLSFFTTRHAANRIAKLITNHSMRPPAPIARTNVPKPLSTSGGGGNTGEMRWPYGVPSEWLQIRDLTGHGATPNGS